MYNLVGGGGYFVTKYWGEGVSLKVGGWVKVKIHLGGVIFFKSIGGGVVYATCWGVGYSLYKFVQNVRGTGYSLYNSWRGWGVGCVFPGGVGSIYLRICRGRGVNCTSGPP